MILLWGPAEVPGEPVAIQSRSILCPSRSLTPGGRSGARSPPSFAATAGGWVGDANRRREACGRPIRIQCLWSRSTILGLRSQRAIASWFEKPEAEAIHLFDN
jgi:hypothetical protein